MAKYRKKPVVIEAEQFFPNKLPWPDGIEQYPADQQESVTGERQAWFGWRVQTLEGPLEARPGDWIITGIKGERYPCKPDIFEATYEQVED